MMCAGPPIPARPRSGLPTRCLGRRYGIFPTQAAEQKKDLKDSRLLTDGNYRRSRDQGFSRGCSDRPDPADNAIKNTAITGTAETSRKRGR